MSKTKWVYFYEPVFYDMFAVRPSDDTDCNSPRLFHVSSREKAEQLCELLNDCPCADVEDKQ